MTVVTPGAAGAGVAVGAAGGVDDGACGARAWVMTPFYVYPAADVTAAGRIDAGGDGALGRRKLESDHPAALAIGNDARAQDEPIDEVVRMSV